MGEVYRADDLKLHQAVALKFLPSALIGEPKLREALYNEVRQARRVSHRHIARVHDIGELLVARDFRCRSLFGVEHLAT